MARFYAEIQGSRGSVSRLGGIKSGIYGEARGWNSGGKVTCYVNDNNEDIINIYVTSGSHGRTQSKLICKIKGKKVEMLIKEDFNL